MNLRLLLLLICAIAFALPSALAKDQGAGSDSGNTGGVPQAKVEAIRFAVSRNSIYNGTPAAQTSIVAAVSSVVGDVVIVPGGVGDTVTIFNSATHAGATNGADVWHYTLPANATNDAAPFRVLFGVPQTFKVNASCPAGIVVSQTMGVTNDGLRVYIQRDTAISGRK